MKKFIFEKFINAYANQITILILANHYRAFLVTKTFANPNAYSLKSVSKHLFQENQRIHIHIQSRLTTNFSKKPELFARSFDFLDVSNTKHSFKINLDAPISPHLHSIYLVHQKTYAFFNRLRQEDFHSVITYKMRSPEAENDKKIRAFPTLKTIDAKPIKLDEIAETISYAAKLLKNISAQNRMSDIDFFDALPRQDKNAYLPKMTLRPFPRAAHMDQQTSNANKSSYL
jgi:hypothetical protein